MSYSIISVTLLMSDSYFQRFHTMTIQLRADIIVYNKFLASHFFFINITEDIFYKTNYFFSTSFVWKARFLFLCVCLTKHSLIILWYVGCHGNHFNRTKFWIIIFNGNTLGNSSVAFSEDIFCVIEWWYSMVSSTDCTFIQRAPRSPLGLIKLSTFCI